MAGGLLLALPVADGFYRGAFDWVNLVVALMGVGGISFAAMGSLRRRLPAAAAGRSKEI